MKNVVSKLSIVAFLCVACASASAGAAESSASVSQCMGVARVAPMVAQARDAGAQQSDIVRGIMDASPGLEWPIKATHAHARSRTERDLINMVGAVYHDPRYVKGVAPAQMSAWAYADCVNDKGGH